MRAFVIGGTGLVGRAIGRRLVAAGWDVDLVARRPASLPPDLAADGARLVTADRNDPAGLASIAAAFGSGADLLVDCVCFTAAQARSLLPLAREASSTVMISSKAVYVDAAGRHSNSAFAPSYGGPVHESQPTLAPQESDYRTAAGYGPNKVAAEQVLLDSGLPVTVVRPSKIHGEGARPPREWVFVKRVLDRREVVLLAHRGEGVDHPTAAANLASLVETAAHRPGRRVLNCADPDAPSGREISRVVARHLDHEWTEVLLDGTSPVSGGLGWHPWDRRPPVVLDTSAAVALGYQAVGDYAATVPAVLDWLVALAGRTPGASLPGDVDDEYFDGRFDYALEDAYLASVSGSAARRPAARHTHG